MESQPQMQSSMSSMTTSSSSSSSSFSSSRIIHSQSYVDHVYSYAGQSYDANALVALNALNELSASNHLCLKNRLVANRDVRILLPVSSLEHAVYEEESLRCDNYETFLFNFNKIALGCYLKVLRASKQVWNMYSMNDDDKESTKLTTVKCGPSEADDFYLKASLEDDEFKKTYLDLVINMHNQIVSKLYVVLLNKPSMSTSSAAAATHVRFHFNQKNSTSNFTPGRSSLKQQSNKSSASSIHSDSHLFRSFRVIGLRKHKYKSRPNRFTNNPNANTRLKPQLKNRLSKNYLIQNDFHEIVDIRSAFDIKQFNNCTGYDCFIECEFNYYKLNGQTIDQTATVTNNVEPDSLDSLLLNFNNKANIRNKNELNFLNHFQRINQPYTNGYYEGRSCGGAATATTSLNSDGNNSHIYYSKNFSNNKTNVDDLNYRKYRSYNPTDVHNNCSSSFYFNKPNNKNNHFSHNS